MSKYFVICVGHRNLPKLCKQTHTQTQTNIYTYRHKDTCLDNVIVKVKEQEKQKLQ